MLYSINEGNVLGYDKGQEPIVHLVSTAQSVEADGRSFVFTDGHATMFLSRMFDHLNNLDQIDWEIMPQRLWHDYDVKYPDRKRKRQSEFLVHQFLPWGLVTEIGVMNFKMRMRVEALLEGNSYKPNVATHREWYY